jgi:hypothetical protein
VTVSTKSPGDELLGRQEPRLKVVPAAAASDAADVIDMCSTYGLVLDEWQRLALEAGLGLREDRAWAADTVAVCAPRQSGKGVLIECRALAGVMLFNERVIACSAHEARTTRLSFERVLAWLDSFDDLRRRVASVQRWVGREQIRFTDGSLIVFPARSRGALRGYSCDALILDEAQYLTNAQHEAVLPTLSARPSTQVWHLGTVPTHLGDGEVFGRLRQTALDGAGARLCYVEWSADPGADLDDRQAWAAANPALGKRISVDAVAAERQALSALGFARERLGLWPVDRVEVVIDPAVWAALVAPGPPDGAPPAALAVDANAAREMAIAGAWHLDDGRVHVELLLADRCDPIDALAWVTEWAGKRVPVVIDGASPAATLINALQAAKVKTVLTTARDMARACGGFIDDVTAGRLSHRGQSQLDTAAVGARKRPIGDAGLWAWDRRDGSVFVAPLVAATLARFGAITAGRPRTNRAVFA